jgi:hypothetical protein
MLLTQVWQLIKHYILKSITTQFVNNVYFPGIFLYENIVTYL